MRYKKRIEIFEKVLRSLRQKNLLLSEDLEIMENFSEWNKNLLNQQICKIKKLKVKFKKT